MADQRSNQGALDAALPSPNRHSGHPHWAFTPDLYPDIASPAYGLRDLLRPLFRRRWLVLLFATGVMIAVLLGALMQTPSYEATAKVLVKKGVAREPLSPRETPMWVSDSLYEEDINTEVGILTSRILIEQAVKAIRSAAVEAPASEPAFAWFHATDRWLKQLIGANAADADAKSKDNSKGGRGLDGYSLQEQVDDMQQSLEVSPEPKSNIISLRFVWPDPREAKAFLDALVDAYQRHRAELYEPAGTESFFRRQTETAAEKLVTAESALQGYLRDAGITIIDVPEGHDVLEAEKRSILDRQKRIDEDLSQTRAQASQLTRLLAKTSEQILSESARVRSESLERQRAVLKGQLTEVEQQRGEQGHRLQRLRAEQAEVSDKLARIRVLEDQLRGLLLRTQNDRSGKALKSEVDRLYSELAQLGQLKRYDLNVGQDTSLYDHLQTQIIDAEVTLSGLDERQQMIQRRIDELASQPAIEPPTAAQHTDRQHVAGVAPQVGDSGRLWTEIELTRATLARAGALLDIEDRRSLAQGFEAMVTLLIDTEAELEGARARIAELETQAAQIEQTLLALNTKGIRAKELRRELARAEAAHRLYREKTDTAAISAAMSREELVNTSIAQPPTVATDPVGPGKRTLVLLGLFVATFGGVGIALLLDYLDPGITTPIQLERRLGIIHLGSVSEGEISGPLDVGLAALFPARADGHDSSRRGRPPTSVPALVYPAPTPG
ncbi:Wzz/FepE/Etk N-terminal domain-containing protein [Halochromatium roseum]|uniref:Wzz/FepE/Etk N-terminal domain-containing protein n=1 Tax=Halochromatium roseum TaxID=391920 RepID=UPI001914A83B|nr:Wzz/FepE/Etk N-terminal domain-containing protein [Halochromatium roseum]MBK5940714.1 hypothetical protein [Halochromatium roseum]